VSIRGTESGSASVVYLAVSAAALLIYSTVFSIGKIGLAQSNLQQSTDLAAIAANQVLNGLNTGYPCQVARAILEANVAHLETCSIVGDETTVAGTTSVVGIVLSATATAAAN
jgi:secretion/DNA translocation related TadE-like protein